METLKKILVFAGILAFVVLGWICGTFLPLRCLKPAENGQEVRDTTWLHDTTYIDNPVPVEVTPKGYELVPIGTIDRITGQILALEDSLEKKPKIVKKDSLIYIDVPMETRHYGDSTYDAWVSGYKPSLDSLRIYTTSMQIDITKPPAPPKRFGIGIQAGLGVQYDAIHKQFGAGPYLGVGFDWRF